MTTLFARFGLAGMAVTLALATACNVSPEDEETAAVDSELAVAAPVVPVYRRATVDVPAQKQVYAAVGCAAGETLIGGGFVNSFNALDLNVTTVDRMDFRASPTWFAIGNNYSALSRPLTSTAICAANVKVAYRATTLDIPAGRQVTAQVACARGESVIGGGFTNSYNARALNVTKAAPYTDKFGAVSWQVTVNNVGSLSRPITATAICAANLPVVYRTTTLDVPVNQQITVRAKCAAGEALVGGGFSNSFNALDLNVTATSPIDAFGTTVWGVTANNYGTLSRPISGTAVCAVPRSAGSGSGSGTGSGYGSGS